MVGDSDQADALKTTSAPFSDVSANRWSAGYIAYLVQKGVLDGMGDGSFDPTAKVTGLQFAKMLLTALGYGVNDEYVGADWAINVSKDALQYGIFDKNLAGANNTPATREECALYAFNTLNLDKVTYSALLGGYITNISLTNTGANNAESNKADTFANDFGLEKTALLDDDAFYRYDGYYYYIGKQTNRITDYYGANSRKKIDSYEPVTGNDIYTTLGASFIRNLDEKNIEVYKDGTMLQGYTSATTFIDNYDEDFSKSNTDALPGTGYGVNTIVYAWTTTTNRTEISHVRIVIIDTFLAQVTKVQAETKTKDVSTTVAIANKYFDKDGDEQTKYIDEFGTAYTFVNTYETEDFAKDTYVLVTASNRYNKNNKYEIQSMTAATLITDEITKFTNTSDVQRVTAGDTTYTDAWVDAVPGDETPTSDIKHNEVRGKEYTLILDAQGYLIALAEPTYADNTYVYVSQFGFVESDNGLKTSVQFKAKVWYTDGTSANVNINNTFTDDADVYNGINKALERKGDPSDADVLDKLNSTADDNPYIGVYVLSLNANGKYDLLKEGTTPNKTKTLFKSNAGDTPYYVIKNIGRLWTGDTKNVAGKYYANKDTVYFYVAGNYPNEKVTVYIGYNNAPSTSGTEKIRGGNILYGYEETVKDDNGQKVQEEIVPPQAMAVAVEGIVDTLSDVYVWNGDYTKGKDQKTVYYDAWDAKTGEDVTLTVAYKDATEASTAINSNLANAVGVYFQLKNGKTFQVFTQDKQTVYVEDYKITDYTDGDYIIVTENADHGYVLTSSTVIFDFTSDGKYKNSDGSFKIGYNVDFYRVSNTSTNWNLYSLIITDPDPAPVVPVTPDPVLPTITYQLKVSILNGSDPQITTVVYDIATQTGATATTVLTAYDKLDDLLANLASEGAGNADVTLTDGALSVIQTYIDATTTVVIDPDTTATNVVFGISIGYLA